MVNSKCSYYDLYCRSYRRLDCHRMLSWNNCILVYNRKSYNILSASQRFFGSCPERFLSDNINDYNSCRYSYSGIYWHHKEGIPLTFPFLLSLGKHQRLVCCFWSNWRVKLGVLGYLGQPHTIVRLMSIKDPEKSE